MLFTAVDSLISYVIDSTGLGEKMRDPSDFE